MYKTILVPVDGSATDRAIIEHIKQLARLAQSRVVFLHVLTGASAKYLGSQAGGQEVEKAQAYLAGLQTEFKNGGIPAETELAYGEPAKEIVSWIKRQGCDLVAMSTHGHQFVADLLLGTTAIKVQHHVSVPVLLLRAR